MRRNRRIEIYSLLALSYFFSYFFRICTTVVLPVLEETLNLSADAAGFISSMYFYTYAVMQPACGILNDKLGPEKTISFGIIITSIGSLCFGIGNNIGLLILGRLLMGIGLSPMLSGLLVYQSTAFPSEKYAHMSGLSMAIGNLGSVVSVAPLSLALACFGREKIFVFLSLLILAVPIFLLKKEKKQKSVPAIKFSIAFKSRFKTAFLLFKASKNLKIIIFSWAIYFGSLMALQGLWALSWFSSVYTDDPMGSRIGASMIGVGVMLGNIIGGKIKSSTKIRHALLQKFAIVIMLVWIFLILALKFKLPITCTVIIATFLGVSNGIVFVQLATTVEEISPVGQGGAVFGFVNFFTFASVIVYQLGTGIIIEQLSGLVRMQGCYFIVFALVSLILVFPIIANKFLTQIKKEAI